MHSKYKSPTKECEEKLGAIGLHQRNRVARFQTQLIPTCVRNTLRT